VSSIKTRIAAMNVLQLRETPAPAPAPAPPPRMVSTRPTHCLLPTHVAAALAMFGS
jgi:hypothetical protein